jgi:hypothetical protein
MSCRSLYLTLIFGLEIQYESLNFGDNDMTI